MISGNFNINFVGPSIARIALRGTKTPIVFKKIRGLRPLAPARGTAPGPQWGLRPQTPAAAPSAARRATVVAP